MSGVQGELVDLAGSQGENYKNCAGRKRKYDVAAASNSSVLRLLPVFQRELNVLDVLRQGLPYVGQRYLKVL